MQRVRINNYIFDVEVLITVLKPDGTEKYIVPVTWDNVSQIEIISDIDLPVLTGTLSFQDIDNILMPYVTDSETNIKVTTNFKQWTTEDMSSNPMNGFFDFIMTSYDILFRDTTKTVYKLSLISNDWIKWENYISYSGEKPYTDHIKNLLTKSELKYDSKNSVTVSEKEFFMTPSNYTLLKSINFILGRYYNTNDGFLFVKRMFGNEKTSEHPFAIKNLVFDKLYDKNSLTFNNFLIPTSQTPTDENFSCRDFKEEQYHDREESIEFNRPYKLYEFDYLKCEMKEPKKINPNDYLKAYFKENKPSKVGFNKAFISDSLKKVDRSFYKENNLIRQYLKQIMFYNNVVSFSVIGMLPRMAGDVCSLFAKTTFDLKDVFAQKYNGQYLVLRNTHTFDKEKYTNYIQASRFEDYKVK